MEAWRHFWRDQIARRLSAEALEGLRRHLVYEAPRNEANRQLLIEVERSLARKLSGEEERESQEQQESRDGIEADGVW